MLSSLVETERSLRSEIVLIWWCVDEFDLGWELVVHLSFPEFVESFFFCDVPMDGGVGAGGAYGLDLSLGGVEEAVLAFGFC